MLRPQKPDPELDFEDETTNGFPILARAAHLYALCHFLILVDSGL